MKKIRIFIISNSIELRNIIKLGLEATNKFEVLTTSIANEGPGMAETHKPDIIIFDITIHDFRGLEIAEELINSASGTSFPIIFFVPPVNTGDQNKYHNQIIPEVLSNLIKQIEKRL